MKSKNRTYKITVAVLIANNVLEYASHVGVIVNVNCDCYVN